MSSLKAQATTPTTALPLIVDSPVVGPPLGSNGSGGGFMSAVSARKQREKGAELEAAISQQLEVNLALEQDQMQGVDETEWVNYSLIIFYNKLT